MPPVSHKHTRVRLLVDGRHYSLRCFFKKQLPPDAPRLVIVSHLPNQSACDILRVCIASIERFTPESHELWVIDNNSPWRQCAWLAELPGINIVFNRTEPVPLEHARRWWCFFKRQSQGTWGSYANGAALELAAQLIDPGSRYFMSLHMDTMPCAAGWLSYLAGKLNTTVKAAGVRMDRGRTPEGVLHVLGMLFDFQLFKKLQLNFLPDIPARDTGDSITIGLRSAGYDVFACRNTLWEPAAAELIPESSPLKQLRADRSFNDENAVIFLHLGRGVKKTTTASHPGLLPYEWVRFAETNLLA